MTLQAEFPLSEWLSQGAYVGYAYSYPHKTAYRPLVSPVALEDLWQSENRDALFGYLHVPFCEMRCGFCNLFTTLDARHELEDEYLNALEKQAHITRGFLDKASFARRAIGGGTPTFLSLQGLDRLFDIAQIAFGNNSVPTSVETSPATATSHKLQLLRERGASRVSIGVQSFLESETRGVGRSQRNNEVETALENIRAAGFPVLNLDLMYGLPHQTEKTLIASLTAALKFFPEEIYLYPLYVRPLTGIGKRVSGTTPYTLNDVAGENSDSQFDALRLSLYRVAREFLLERGYGQVSMRMFRAAHAPDEGGPLYCCQSDGMVGLGCGARSYTTGLHYSSEYAVGSSGIRSILNDYITRPDARFARAEYGFSLNEGEKQRRFLIQSLMQSEGLNFANYQEQYKADVFDHWPSLLELLELDLAARDETSLRLTAHGLEYSDSIGPWLYSASVYELSDEYELQ